MTFSANWISRDVVVVAVIKPATGFRAPLASKTFVLACIRLLYDVEREARDSKLNSEQRYELRQAKTRPILEDIQTYLERQQPQVLPKSPIGQAIGYTLSNWQALVRYRDDGDLEIDNNGAERTLRVVAVGRKN